jgi:hypothetical protein
MPLHYTTVETKLLEVNPTETNEKPPDFSLLSPQIHLTEGKVQDIRVPLTTVEGAKKR